MMFDDSYDTFSLRSNANFCFEIYPKVWWLPYNCLGKSKYTNYEMKKFQNLCLSKLRLILHSPYELAQYVQVSQFGQEIDIEYQEDAGRIWETHQNPEYLLRQHKGSCATFAGFFYDILHVDFAKVFNLCIITNEGQGHALNYIVDNGWYYFFDLYSLIPQFSWGAAVEVGSKTSFHRTKIMTSMALKTKTLDDFFSFYNKYYLFRRKKFLFYSTQACSIPPISYERHQDKMNIYLREADICEIYLPFQAGQNFYIEFL